MHKASVLKNGTMLVTDSFGMLGIGLQDSGVINDEQTVFSEAGCSLIFKQVYSFGIKCFIIPFGVREEILKFFVIQLKSLRKRRDVNALVLVDKTVEEARKGSKLIL